MIARVADHCFWFGRYLERAEATVRSLESTREALMGADLEERQSWLPIIIAAGEQQRFTELHGRENPQAARDGALVQDYMVWELRNSSSLRSSVMAVHSNARSIRDHLSLEVWEQINELRWWFENEAEEGSARWTWKNDRHDFYGKIVRSMALTAGLLHSTMLRDTPLDFILLGSMLERAGQTARILDVQHHALELSQPHVVIDTALWLALLRACAGYEPYMRRHRGRVSGSTVATFLIRDPRFPRSIGFALESALERLAAIRPPSAAHLPGGGSQARLRELHAWLLARRDDELAGSAVHAVLTHVVDEVHTICSEVGVELLGQG
ncbi:MAG: alpha-E domain-containing protein [Myxococcales bacterium]|nr:alpha-E domain-containing protein [Myxococcales bacterium]